MGTMLRLPLLLCCAVLLTLAAAERPLFHPLFADHCVLQRDRPIPIWGWTTPGATVQVRIAGQTAEAVAEADGRWRVTLPALPAGGPHELTLSGPAEATVRDVLIGEVWLCSGQSNMEQGVKVSRDAAAEIAAADHPQLRLCWVRKHIAVTPQPLNPLTWAVCTPETLGRHGTWGGFSAVAYHFGRTLQQELGVPVGLIHASWGGTPAQAWVSAGGLLPLKDFAGSLETLATVAVHGESDYPARLQTWWTQRDAGTTAEWHRADTDATAWATMELPGLWEERGLPNVDGVVWFQRRIEVPEAFADRELILSLAAIDDHDTTWIDGTLVGSSERWNEVRRYRIPAGVVTAGMRTIAVRVLDTGAKGGFHGKAEDMWIGLADDPSQRVSLAGEWRYHPTVTDSKVLRTMPRRIGDNPHFPTVLANGMLAPIDGTEFAGAIWYQGESNAGNPSQYRRLLPALIADWRTRFGNDALHVGIVQLASFMPRVEQPVQDGWSALREAQAMTVAADPRTSLAVAIDIGEANDIHPKNKQDVGRRLALGVLATHYGREIVGSGPVYHRLTVEERAIRLHFTHATGLTTTDDAAPLGFALAGPDGVWHRAQATIADETVIVRADAVQEPRAVRYAWANNPAVNVVNGAGLPMVPFRTDGP